MDSVLVTLVHIEVRSSKAFLYWSLLLLSVHMTEDRYWHTCNTLLFQPCSVLTQNLLFSISLLLSVLSFRNTNTLVYVIMYLWYLVRKIKPQLLHSDFADISNSFPQITKKRLSRSTGIRDSYQLWSRSSSRSPEKTSTLCASRPPTSTGCPGPRQCLSASFM